MGNAVRADAAPKGDGKHRITCYVDEDDYQMFRYYAKKRGLSINELLHESFAFYIAKENGDYDLPSLEAQRLNQIVDVLTGVTVNLKAVEEVCVHGFDSIREMARGDNYLGRQGLEGYYD